MSITYQENDVRRSLVAANWKMNGSLSANKAWVDRVLPGLPAGGVSTLLCAPYVYLPSLAEMIRGSTLMLGAQNVSAEVKGAFTGEISAAMLFDIGVRWCIIGHAERRTLYGETDAVVARKAERCAEAGIRPLLCVGESLHERETGRTLEVVAEQLTAVIDAVGVKALGAVAYEPVWAIGTGKIATPQQAQDVHEVLRGIVAKYDAAVGETLPILYGGSVKPDNAASLFAGKDIDGGLLGGAGLKAEDFLAVVRAKC